LQREDATIADAVKEWLNLGTLLFGNQEFENFLNKWKPMIFCDAALLAYCLHPRHRGKRSFLYYCSFNNTIVRISKHLHISGDGLSGDDFRKAQAFASKKHPQLLSAVLKLRIQAEDIFPKNMFTAVVIDCLTPSQ
jgi:hypothetical protein